MRYIEVPCAPSFGVLSGLICRQWQQAIAEATTPYKPC
jgi:hypothetical protein